MARQYSFTSIVEPSRRWVKKAMSGGRPIWWQGLARTPYWDQGTSPVLTRDYVVIARKQHGESWVAAFDKGTGQIRWKAPRNYETAVEGDDAYTTPLVIDHHGKEALLVWGAEHVTAHHPSD